MKALFLMVACLVVATGSFGATISFESPRGGEVYAPGQMQTVRLGVKTAAKTVNIELSRDGGATFEPLGFVNNKAKDPAQRYILKFTVVGPFSSNCVLRASGTVGKSNLSVLSSPFMISSITPPDGSITPAKLNSGASSSGYVLTADGSGGAEFGPLPLDTRYVKVTGDTMTGALNVGNIAVSNNCTITNNQGGTAFSVTTTTGGRPGSFTVMNGGGQPALAVNSDSVGTAALQVTDSGGGQALTGTNSGTGVAGEFRITNAANTSRALFAATSGTGPALVASQLGPTGDIAIFEGAPATNVARIDKSGKGFFNSGTQMGGADLAEAFQVEGPCSLYSPGDVVIISKSLTRTVAKSDRAYSTLVSGVYATKPGVLLSENSIDASLANTIPMGVVGVIPTKVCTENGAIHRGDFLVTSSTPGHAMKGTDRARMLGAIIGKALEEFDGDKPGKILVLVNVK